MNVSLRVLAVNEWNGFPNSSLFAVMNSFKFKSSMTSFPLVV